MYLFIVINDTYAKKKNKTQKKGGGKNGFIELVNKF